MADFPLWYRIEVYGLIECSDVHTCVFCIQMNIAHICFMQQQHTFATERNSKCKCLLPITEYSPEIMLLEKICSAKKKRLYN